MKPVSITIEIHEVEAKRNLFGSLIQTYDDNGNVTGEVSKKEQETISKELEGKVFYLAVVTENSLGMQRKFKSTLTTQENRIEIVRELIKTTTKAVSKILDHPEYMKDVEEPSRIIRLNGSN